MTLQTDWPVLTRYDATHQRRVAMPLGGLGTGTVSLGGRGDLRDWEIVNRPAKGFTPSHCFFAVRVARADGSAVTRVLEGPLPLEEYQGEQGAKAPNHGLPRFRQCAFEAAYPLGQVLLSDANVPVTVRLQAFNPLLPGDSENSGLPLAFLRFVVTNTSDESLQIALCGNLKNFIGCDGTADDAQANRNQWREGEGVRGLFLSSEGVPKDAESWGTMALATSAANVTYRTAWADLSWGDSLLDFWDDFQGDGRLEERASAAAMPVASLCANVEIAPGAGEEISFVLAWHFPNRFTWTPDETAERAENIIGNYYCTRFEDAWDAAEFGARAWPDLEARTVEFVAAFCQSDLPAVVKEAALYNLSSLRCQTSFRARDGHFFGWEGCGDHRGSCFGSCTHVWNYEQATAFLWGDLSRSMREVEFNHATDESGLMSFRVHLPLERATDFGMAAADGQMGCLMKLYRDWQGCGDDDFLRKLWPGAKRALEFCWIEGGWDADRDGVMEGCQHNTMDVEYFGPNPQMQGWYLGALRAAEEMAKYLGEAEFAAQCRRLFENGSRWMDENLFNGDYYEHQIRPIPDASNIAPGLQHGRGATNLSEPELQLGAGCLIDQLAGQTMAHVCGLGYLLDKANVQTTLRSLMRFNFREDLWNHFNHLRTFALGDEAAMLMATYPRGRRPARPFPYYNEAMTGFEYTAAAAMLYEDREADGLKVIGAIRARYDGERRNPFDEAECGHHYARAMASWAAILALTGFGYSAVTQTLTFAAWDEPVQWFWSNGCAWGTVSQTPRGPERDIELKVRGGEISVRALELRGYGRRTWSVPQHLSRGASARWSVAHSQ